MGRPVQPHCRDYSHKWREQDPDEDSDALCSCKSSPSPAPSSPPYNRYNSDNEEASSATAPTSEADLPAVTNTAEEKEEEEAAEKSSERLDIRAQVADIFKDALAVHPDAFHFSLRTSSTTTFPIPSLHHETLGNLSFPLSHSELRRIASNYLAPTIDTSHPEFLDNSNFSLLVRDVKSQNPLWTSFLFEKIIKPANEAIGLDWGCSRAQIVRVGLLVSHAGHGEYDAPFPMPPEGTLTYARVCIYLPSQFTSEPLQVAHGEHTHLLDQAQGSAYSTNALVYFLDPHVKVTLPKLTSGTRICLLWDLVAQTSETLSRPPTLPMSEEIAIAKLRDLCTTWCKYAEEDALTSQEKDKDGRRTAPHLILPLEDTHSTKKSVKIARILKEALSGTDVRLFKTKLHHRYHFSIYENNLFEHGCGWTHRLGERTFVDHQRCANYCFEVAYLKCENRGQTVYKQGNKTGEETCFLSSLYKVDMDSFTSSSDEVIWSKDKLFGSGKATLPVSTKETYVVPYTKDEKYHSPRVATGNMLKDKFYKPSIEVYKTRALVFWPKTYSNAIDLSTYTPLVKARLIGELVRQIKPSPTATQNALSSTKSQKELDACRFQAQRFLTALAQDLAALAETKKRQSQQAAQGGEPQEEGSITEFSDFSYYLPQLLTACVVLKDRKSLRTLLGIEDLAKALRPTSPDCTASVIEAFGIEDATPILEAIFTHKPQNESYGYAAVIQSMVDDKDTSRRILELLFSKSKSVPGDKPHLSLRMLRETYGADCCDQLVKAIPKTHANLEYWIRQFDEDPTGTAALRLQIVPELAKTLEKQDYYVSVQDELMLYKLLQYVWTDEGGAKEVEAILEAFLSLLQTPSPNIRTYRQVAATRKLENIRDLVQGCIHSTPFVSYYRKNLVLFYEKHGKILAKGRPDPSTPKNYVYRAPTCTCSECLILQGFMVSKEETKYWQSAKRHHTHLTTIAEACGRVKCVSFQPPGTSRYHFKVTKHPKTYAERLLAYDTAVPHGKAIIDLMGGMDNIQRLVAGEPESSKILLGLSNVSGLSQPTPALSSVSSGAASETVLRAIPPPTKDNAYSELRAMENRIAELDAKRKALYDSMQGPSKRFKA